jgi:hypothetical protein
MRLKFWTLIVLVFLLCTIVSQVQAVESKFIGEVNDNYQLVTDDQIYEVEPNEVGERLVNSHISEKVEVIGAMREEEGVKIIQVKYFKVIRGE